MAQPSAIVVGAGIVGLAITRALATRGYQVTVIERNAKAIGASVRNFGMVWPVGQPDGPLFDRAMLSRSIWQEVCRDAGIWYEQKGSLHLAYRPDECQVLKELSEIYHHRGYRLLDKQQVLQTSPVVVEEGLLGGLYSADEMVVNPPKAIAALAAFFREQLAVQFIWGTAVTDIRHPMVRCGKDAWEADEIFVCNGVEFETLYRDQFYRAPLTKCKLQMMRLQAPDGLPRIGPSLCGALSLLHYSSFKASNSLPALRQRLQHEHPEAIRWGIHVMASQHESATVTIGDSHEYGSVPEPFDRQEINSIILNYLLSFADFTGYQIRESWNGVYAKMTDGQSECIFHPEPGVTVINGLGGAGMTLSFGLCEQFIASGRATATAST